MLCLGKTKAGSKKEYICASKSKPSLWRLWAHCSLRALVSGVELVESKLIIFRFNWAATTVLTATGSQKAFHSAPPSEFGESTLPPTQTAPPIQ